MMRRAFAPPIQDLRISVQISRRSVATDDRERQRHPRGAIKCAAKASLSAAINSHEIMITDEY